MALIDEINTKAAAYIAVKEHGKIAELVSVGRTRPSTLTIGYGTILETIGITDGNKVLDVFTTDPAFKYVKPLLEQGRLIAGSPLVVAAVQSLVPLVITQVVADKLLALTKVPDPVSVDQVINAMKGV